MRDRNDPQTALLQLYKLFLDLEPSELELTDPDRLEHARSRFRDEAAAVSIWGDEMTWGVYSLTRPGLERRLKTLIEIGEAPATVIEQMATWSDDEVRAWIARHEYDMTNKAVAKDRWPGRASA